MKYPVYIYSSSYIYVFFHRIDKPEVLYSCKSSAKPIVHDTLLQLKVEREIFKNMLTAESSESNLLFEEDEGTNQSFTEHVNVI